MDLGKYLILTATLGSLVACSSTPVQRSSSVENAVIRDYNSISHSAILLYNFVSYKRYGLTADQKSKQTAAVYSALESDYGILYNWYDEGARGAVKAVHGYPQGSGFCKVVYSLIEVKGVQRHYEETACKEAGHEGWRFVHKPR